MDKRPSRQDQGQSGLKQLREELGMSQNAFARETGITPRTISRWEAGDSKPLLTVPQIKALNNLLKRYGKSIDDLPDTFGPLDR